MASQVLYINHPYFSGGASRAGIQYPRNAVIHAQALFQILSHSMRRQPAQQRVVGTLLGTRNEEGTEVEVKQAYVIPVTEDDSEVSVDIDYHVDMYNLLRKSHPDQQIVGWYTTSPAINNMSALIHEFYSQENGTFPHPAVHVTVDPNAADIKLSAYVGLPMWTSPENEVDGNCIFVPIKHTVTVRDADQPALAAAAQPDGADVLGLSQNVDDAMAQVVEQIDAVLAKVAEARKAGPSPESDALARYLYRIIAAAPVLEAPSTAVPHKAAQSGSGFDPRSAMYNAHMRDLVTIVNLANSIKWQLQLTSEVSSKLAGTAN